MKKFFWFVLRKVFSGRLGKFVLYFIFERTFEKVVDKR